MRKRSGLYPSAGAGGFGWFVSGWFADDRGPEPFLSGQSVNVMSGGFNHGTFVACGGQDSADVGGKFSVGEFRQGFYFCLKLFRHVYGQLGCARAELICFLCHGDTMDQE